MIAVFKTTFNYSYNEIMNEIPFVNLQLQYASLYFKSKEVKTSELTKKEKEKEAKKQNNILNSL